MSGDPLSLVAMPFAALDDLVERWRRPDGLGAHVTLLPPRPGVTGDLARALAGEVALTARFERVGRFGDRVVFLAPSDPEPLRALAQRLAGAFGVALTRPVVPHVTVARARDVEDLGAVERVLRGVSLETELSVVALYERGSSTWVVRERVSLPSDDGGAPVRRSERRAASEIPPTLSQPTTIAPQ